MASSSSHLDSSCIFCRIIQGSIPSVKLMENEHVFAFFDINPLSEGHCLVVPKYHAQKTHEVPDEYLKEVLPVASKIIKALGCSDYNILQNNGKLAHQEVMHVHYHVIPKPNASEGLGVRWPAKPVSPEKLKELAKRISPHL